MTATEHHIVELGDKRLDAPIRVVHLPTRAEADEYLNPTPPPPPPPRQPMAVPRYGGGTVGINIVPEWAPHVADYAGLEWRKGAFITSNSVWDSLEDLRIDGNGADFAVGSRQGGEKYALQNVELVNAHDCAKAERSVSMRRVLAWNLRAQPGDHGDCVQGSGNIRDVALVESTFLCNHQFPTNAVRMAANIGPVEYVMLHRLFLFGGSYVVDFDPKDGTHPITEISATEVVICGMSNSFFRDGKNASRWNDPRYYVRAPNLDQWDITILHPDEWRAW